MEGRELTQRARPVRLAAHRELEPREPGHAHLGAQPQHPPRAHLLDAPAVDDVAHREPPRVAWRPQRTGTAAEPGQRAPRPPRKRPRVPAPLTTDLLHDLPHELARGVDPGAPLVTVERAACPVRVVGQRVARCARKRRGGPPRRDVGLLDALEGEAYGVVETE